MYYVSLRNIDKTPYKGKVLSIPCHCVSSEPKYLTWLGPQDIIQLAYKARATSHIG